MASNAASLNVQVCFATGPHALQLCELTLPEGSTVADAVRASGLLQNMSPAEQDALATAVWGKLRDPATPLRAHDRVELLRALKVDPKEARRQRYRRDGIRKAPRSAG